ncbi:Cytochrome c556 [Aliiroseovarius halocynthiae]|uniref:Cytochrome c n=1 Tax=Aliiroseovarius halocynthiae TaxID=985055 RepID=A0A545SZJ7_9RHOB|nr:cytochrome c [Aliiroseovarius halocynthiae]TQV70395.1 cytochrome c [Aliiroseovarius halocynthiae]SMR81889.1 Cytochrome c556 [Aliiroseovarius halocynthiae]
MKVIKPFAIAAIALSTSVAGAIAHADATNPAVIKRMEAMKAIGGSMKTLAGMAKGEMAFDAAKANAAVATISEQGMMVPALFEANETDPETEALPAIWENWDDFVKKSDDMVMAAKGVPEIADQGAIGAALGQIGGTCKACHDDYRKK